MLVEMQFNSIAETRNSGKVWRQHYLLATFLCTLLRNLLHFHWINVVIAVPVDSM